MAAVSMSARGVAFKYATSELQSDLSFVEQVVSCKGWALEHTQEFRANRMAAMLAVPLVASMLSDTSEWAFLKRPFSAKAKVPENGPLSS